MDVISPYYLEHFQHVLSFVKTHYGAMLTPHERRYVDTVRHLSPHALNLYIRLQNRKGPYFRISKINYDECQPIKQALQELISENLLAPCAEGSITSAHLWNCFTYSELQQFFTGTAPKCSKKSELIRWLNSNATSESINAILLLHPAVMKSPGDPWEFLKFLFFGELTDNLSGFVVQELGHIVTEKMAVMSLCPNFTHRQEALATFHLAKCYQDFRQLRETHAATDIFEWWQKQNIARELLPDKAMSLHNRLTDRLGRLLERANDDTKAMFIYAATAAAPHRERYARLLIKCGKKSEATSLCEQMLIDPADNNEAYVAKQLLARLQQKKSCSDTRYFLNSAPQMTVKSYGQTVESSVLNHYQNEGWEGFHSENWPWNSLFGLLLWDIIYDPSYGSFHQPLQMAPSDLYQSGFYAKRKEAIEARLSLLTNHSQCLALLENHYAEKNGILNPFVAWHENTLALITRLLYYLPTHAISGVIRQMAQDVNQRKGFPDLFLWRDQDYQLIEVKSPNDQLSIQQYHWLQFFAASGVKALVLKVNISQEQLQYA